jgi:hypothetical protein
LVAALEAREGHLSDRVLLVGGLVGRQKWSVCGEREVDTREADDNINLSASRRTRRITHGTRFVWNSLRSTLREPVKRREAVTEETT